ncbi:IPT/TIG domain-containing protein (plasmid) [Streptomyces scopuliridis]|uniref:IPT/TIG domain-containing protein n=1 Tax=Streptomyces scopuliridis TaxID=452529 RepID=A0ACD4ZZ69_9ACTN|nr:IPT/TIG domain-containing protein [Streptomyces scopuliridis]WSB39282.1 IPT/TIG domain-containing protein [Streptomyces scopuliridis]WSC03531.1 IPT/TIG domain-containing protein [Streptomyces scopuliridis]WSC11325.1 IPT/TIG domain-containing protein [Streptomyces scopuliridis]
MAVGVVAVTITGTNLGGTTAVNFGPRPATDVINVSPTQLTAVSPSGTGAVEVTVTTPGGNSNPEPFFYLGAPWITSVTPAAGPFGGGGSVTLTGLNLATVGAVNFGANAGTITSVSDTAITVTVPRADGVGTVPITVVTAGGSADGISYTYEANPFITALDPISGPASGGNAVTITGGSLSTTEQVVFGPGAVHGGGQIASFTIVSDTEIVAVAPPEAAGAADIVIQSPGGNADMLSAYTYLAGPGI